MNMPTIVRLFLASLYHCYLFRLHANDFADPIAYLLRYELIRTIEAGCGVDLNRNKKNPQTMRVFTDLVES